MQHIKGFVLLAQLSGTEGYFLLGPARKNSDGALEESFLLNGLIPFSDQNSLFSAWRRVNERRTFSRLFLRNIFLHLAENPEDLKEFQRSRNLIIVAMDKKDFVERKNVVLLGRHHEKSVRIADSSSDFLMNGLKTFRSFPDVEHACKEYVRQSGSVGMIGTIVLSHVNAPLR